MMPVCGMGKHPMISDAIKALILATYRSFSPLQLPSSAIISRIDLLDRTLDTSKVARMHFGTYL